MAHLIFRDSEGGEMLVPLEKQDLIIGRSRTCQIQSKDPAVSRQHVHIYAIREGGYEIEPIAGSGGLWCQGRRIEQRQPMQSGIPYSLGNSLLIYESQSVPTKQNIQFELVCQQPHIRPKRYLLAPGRHTIGRGREHHLCIQDTSLSRYHAQIYVGEDQIVVTDQDSANGTYVNQQLCNGPVVVHLGDILQFGTISYRLAQRATSHSFEGLRPYALPASLSIVVGYLIFSWIWPILTAPTKTTQSEQESQTAATLPNADVPEVVQHPAEQMFWQQRANAFSQAKKSFAKKQYHEAQQHFAAVLQIDPLYQPAWLGRAQAYRHVQQQTQLRQYELAQKMQQPLRALTILQHAIFQTEEQNEYQEIRLTLANERYEQLLMLAKEFNHAQDWIDGYRYALQALRHVPQGAVAKALAQESYLQLPKISAYTWPLPANLSYLKELQIPKLWSKKTSRFLLRYASGNYQDSFTIFRQLEQRKQLTQEEQIEWSHAMDWTSQLNQLMSQQAWREMASIEVRLEQFEQRWLPTPLFNQTQQERQDRFYEQSCTFAEQAFHRGSYANAFAAWNFALLVRNNDRAVQARLAEIEHRANALLTELTSRSESLTQVDCKMLQEILLMSKEQSTIYRTAMQKLEQIPMCQNKNNATKSKRPPNKELNRFR